MVCKIAQSYLTHTSEDITQLPASCNQKKSLFTQVCDFTPGVYIYINVLQEQRENDLLQCYLYFLFKSLISCFIFKGKHCAFYLTALTFSYS